MTPQEAFERSYLGLMNQGCRSVRKIIIRNKECVACSYRGENGNKCGIGQIVPDSLQPELWDTESDSDVYSVIGNSSDACAYFKGIDIFFLKDIQSIHDDAHGQTDEDELSVDEFRKKITKGYESLMRRLTSYKLVLPEWKPV